VGYIRVVRPLLRWGHALQPVACGVGQRDVFADWMKVWCPVFSCLLASTPSQKASGSCDDKNNKEKKEKKRERERTH